MASAASFSNCDSSAPVQIMLKSLPDPVRLVSGGKIPLSGTLLVKKLLPTKLKLKVKVEKKILWGYISLPCISNVGSCEYILDCSTLLGQCPTCRCPVPAGTHPVDQSVTVPPISIPSFLTNGDYKVTFDARDASNNQRISCGQLKLRISS
ncbi:ganglioside GM2 activator-like [Rhopilema esculentum]|uniref:ganglioside GM2 activator-like n=1 Tax=Rhopilema esculentum TaxID=499914 RepID=UPI0031E165C0